MTYCVGLYLRDGLVLLSDTRTNAGVDHVSCFGKMQVEEVPGERLLVLQTAGNLALTQAVWNRLQEGVRLDGRRQTLREVPNMFQAAQLVGQAVRDVYQADGPALSAQGVGFDLSLLLGGQIQGGPPRLYLVYAAGNFIEATPDTPFLQIGEVKYGKPILDRNVQFDTSLPDGVKLALISMDGTLRSNLTVGMPVDLLTYRTDSFAVALRRRLGEDDAYFRTIREGWAAALRRAYQDLPAPDWGRSGGSAP
ncbi:peptidase [Paracraurococcus ruber]|uniref:Peptidase n=1 Tax=Paracraurococcus ruber TaxID=77675 RepID=A0ABS1CWA2_9PROT|nr:peptidase [Paracraurococcus ruber]MBK1658800.1 peptidase [Paracraurococcus ruber]TDG33204.1 peptidase [Paracraurococcus ruber]